MKVDSIVCNAGQLVTCASKGHPKKGAEKMRELGIIENGAVAIEKGKIQAIGNSEKILRDFATDNLIDAQQKVVCPGFVECHTHLVFAGNRLDEFEQKIQGADYLEVLKSGGGILSTVRATREAAIEDLIEESKKRLDQLLELGVTTCEIKTGYGLDSKSEFKMLEAIDKLDRIHPIDLIPTFLPAHAVPPQFKENSDDYVDLICREMIPRATLWYSESNYLKKYQPTFPLADYPVFIDVFCEKNAFSLEQTKRIFEVAKKQAFKIKAHVDEFTNLGGARLALEFSAASIDHLDTISDEEIKLLARSDTIGVITPTVNFNFGSAHFANARKMIDEGCAIAVSTDFNPGSAPCPSLPNAMAIACRYQKLLPSEALNGATINAAFANTIGHLVGSIEERKFADLLILETDDYRQMCYEFGGNLVGTVIKNGEIVHRR